MSGVTIWHVLVGTGLISTCVGMAGAMSPTFLDEPLENSLIAAGLALFCLGVFGLVRLGRLR